MIIILVFLEHPRKRRQRAYDSESLCPMIYLKFTRMLRRLFLSVVSVTRVVYFHVNVTCFAAKHLKFDSHYSN